MDKNIVESLDIIINGTIYKDKISKEDTLLELMENPNKKILS